MYPQIPEPSHGVRKDCLNVEMITDKLKKTLSLFNWEEASLLKPKGQLISGILLFSYSVTES